MISLWVQAAYTLTARTVASRFGTMQSVKSKKIVRALLSTTEDRTEQTDAMPEAPTKLSVKFPNAGKILEEMPPRMRFAPSPTGR